MPKLTEGLLDRLAFVAICGGIFGVNPAAMSMFKPLADAGVITIDPEGIGGRHARITTAGRAALAQASEGGAS